MFVKIKINQGVFLEEYQGVEPDIKTGSYVVYISDHHVDLIHFKNGVFSMSHLCLPHNSCIALAMEFIESLKKQAKKKQTQLSLF